MGFSFLSVFTMFTQLFSSFYNFWNKILLKVLAYTFWCIDRFQNHRNLNYDLYPRKSSGTNDKHFQGLPCNNFSNPFYWYSQFLRSILPFNLLIYSSAQKPICTEIRSLFRKIQTKAIPNALGFWAVWNDALEWCRVVINLTRSSIR